MSKSYAEVIMTPHTCLGGWDNPSNAAGVPEAMNSAPGDYSQVNSASVTDMLADIYCGDFSGDIPKDTKPSAIVIKFSWALVPKSEQVAVPASIQDIASSTNQILDAAPDSVGQSSTSPSSQPDNQATSSDTSQQGVAPAQTPSDVSAPTSDSLQSYFAHEISALLSPRIAYAENISTSSDEMATSTADVLAVTGREVLEVSYSLDGTDWHALAAVTPPQFAENSFIIPTDVVPGWSDLEHLQIRVRRLSSLNDIGTVYLDGMVLSVEYVKSSNELSNEQLQARDSALSAYQASLPDRHLHIIPGTSVSNKLSLSQDVASDGREELVVSAPQGSLIVYSDERGFTLADGVGQEPIHIPAYNFLPGRYILIVTDEPDGCGTMTLAECMSDPNLVASAYFKVVDVDSPPSGDAILPDSVITATTTP